MWAKARSPESPNIESALILGLTEGALLIRYLSFSASVVEGDHWYSTLEEAKQDAEQDYGVGPTAWQALPEEKDELYELSVMPIERNTYNSAIEEWERSISISNCGIPGE
ncbi:hypothetical protein K6V92_24145 [Cupriavidus respiraculi]|nr:hypothetical protein [Cupriavidus respiraculi]